MIWNVRDEIAVTKHYTDPIQEILAKRGIHKTVDFLSPSMNQLRDPWTLPDISHAISLTSSFMAGGKKIRIFGDYDSDGIDATTIMVLGFRELGTEVDYYIPERHEGYGLNRPAIEQAHQDGVDLIITCDTGVTAAEEVKYIRELGMEVIVTDHHEPQEEVPDCCVINPQLSHSNFGFGELSGSGVAFYFMMALYDELHPRGKQAAYFLLPWVAIGTIADVMPLIEDNRILVTNGLAMISQHKNYGLRNLLKVTKLKEVTAKDVGWVIGPILNATGRLSKDRKGQGVSARRAVDMFLDKSRLRTYRIASELLAINELRKELTKEYTAKVIEYVDNHPMHKKSKVMVIAFPSLPEGLVGLIAGKLKEHYHRPVLLMTDDGQGIWKGSGRSVPAYHLFDELSSIKNFFLKFGGHAMACGFSLREDNIEYLRAVLNNLCQLDDADLQPMREIDFTIDPALVDLEFADALKTLEPFGKGNGKPSFAFFDAQVKSVRQMGKNKQHLGLTIQVDDYTFQCVGWNLWKKWEELGQPKWIDLAFYPEVNEYNGRSQVQLRIQDVRDITDEE